MYGPCPGYELDGRAGAVSVNNKTYVAQSWLSGISQVYLFAQWVKGIHTIGNIFVSLFVSLFISQFSENWDMINRE